MENFHLRPRAQFCIRSILFSGTGERHDLQTRKRKRHLEADAGMDGSSDDEGSAQPVKREKKEPRKKTTAKKKANDMLVDPARSNVPDLANVIQLVSGKAMLIDPQHWSSKNMVARSRSA